MRERRRIGIAVLVAALCAGAAPALADPDKNESGKREREGWGEHRGKRDKHDDRGHERRGRSYFHDHGHAQLNIPKGHYPPPGECRVWFPDRPPGHQPPPGKCGQLRSEVPHGAWLIHRPSNERKHVHVNVYDVQQPTTVVHVGVFQIDTGSFVRELRGR